MSSAVPSLLRVTTSLLNRTISRFQQIHQSVYSECCYNSKTIMSPSSIDLAKRCWLQMPCLTIHPSRLQRYHWTSPSTMCTSHLTEKLSSRLSYKMTQSTTPLLRQSSQVGQTISMMSHMLYAHTMATKTPSHLKMASSFEVKLSSFLHWKGRRSSKQYMKDTSKSASAKTEPDTVCIGLESN